MHRKFEINPTKIKGGCQSGTKVVIHDSKNDLPLVDSFSVLDTLSWVKLRKLSGLRWLLSHYLNKNAMRVTNSACRSWKKARASRASWSLCSPPCKLSSLWPLSSSQPPGLNSSRHDVWPQN